MEVTDDQRSKVVVLLVTYNSSSDELRTNLAGLSGNDLILCDNSTISDHAASIGRFAESVGAQYLPMAGNKGIAYAQNRGIELARSAGAEFVLLLDDDSRIEPEAVSNLVRLYRAVSITDRKVAAVSARPVDRNGSSFRERFVGHQEAIACREMMSSGSLIPMSAFAVLGSMEEALFIDYVDFEWGWRAYSMGYSLYLATHITFLHSLGEGNRSFLGLSLKNKPPVRHYYQTRNFLQMLPRRYVPISWKIRQSAALLARSFAFPLLLSPRITRLSWILRGLADGLFRSRFASR